MMEAKAILPSQWVLLIFRAWQHFYLLQHFGGVPISDHVLTVSDGVLQAPRNSRYEVAAFIMSDLREAVKHLPKETEIPEGSKGKVSKEAAKSFWPEYCFMRLRGKSMFLLSIMI